MYRNLKGILPASFVFVILSSESFHTSISLLKKLRFCQRQSTDTEQLKIYIAVKALGSVVDV